MIRRMMAAAAVAAVCGTVQADVVYNWQTTEIGNVGPFNARLTVTDQAYLSGSLNERYTSDSYLTTQLVNFTLFWPGGPQGSGLGLNFQQRNGTTLTGATPLTNWSLIFLPNGTLSGRFEPTNDFAGYVFSGLSDQWSVLRYATDAGGFACESNVPVPSVTPCTGAGRWLVDASTVPGNIPEPGMLPLMALGAVGVAASLRRRKAA